jgi:ABC-2 type transport system ATP-binding protein
MIELNNIVKSYQKTKVLNDISLSIEPGCVYGLVGKNGVGKTTLLNIISGISSPTSGSCFINGTQVKKGVAIKDLSYLPDLPSFFDYLTVEEYLKFVLSATNKSVQKTIDAHIEPFGINKKAVIKNLSRGNKQKVGLIVATITKPTVLLLDEPTSALDPVGRKDVINMIKDLKKLGTTIIFSTHILSDIELVCDKIGLLHNGVIKEFDLREASNNESYEITFNSNDIVSDITDIFSGFNCNAYNNTIVVHDIKQEKLLSILSEQQHSIMYIRRLSSINRINTVMEVLEQ